MIIQAFSVFLPEESHHLLAPEPTVRHKRKAKSPIRMAAGSPSPKKKTKVKKPRAPSGKPAVYFMVPGFPTVFQELPNGVV